MNDGREPPEKTGDHRAGEHEKEKEVLEAVGREYSSEPKRTFRLDYTFHTSIPQARGFSISS